MYACVFVGGCATVYMFIWRVCNVIVPVVLCRRFAALVLEDVLPDWSVGAIRQVFHCPGPDCEALYFGVPCRKSRPLQSGNSPAHFPVVADSADSALETSECMVCML